MRYLILPFIILIISFSPKLVTAEEMIKVKLVQHIGETKKIKLHIKGDYSTLDPTLKLKEGINYQLSLKKGEFILAGNGEKYSLHEPFILIPKRYNHTQYISINNRQYLGAVEFRKEKNQFIRPGNQLPMEDYLKGVVPFEVYPSWGIETLKAQALAARTYAFANLDKEIDDTIKYQVYGGFSWNEKTTEAVEETSGEVITSQNRLIDAFYSASNGGMTENNTNVWGGNAKSYLPIKRDPYDPTHPWEFSIHQTQIKLDEINWDQPDWWDKLSEIDSSIINNMKTWLKKNGYPGEIKIVEIPYFKLSEKLLESKRAVMGSIKIEFLHRLLDGTIVYDHLTLNDVPLNNIRPLIGGNHFKSYYIESLVKDGEGHYTMKGKGFGHGVGMSQWGAHYMGKAGKNYKDIIQFYYPGTKIKKIN